MELYEVISSMPAGVSQDLGLKLIDELSETKFTQIDKRDELLNKCAGESIKLIAKWLKSYTGKNIDNNPDKNAYAEKVKYDLVLRDPVPGFITKLFHKKNDLRKVPNLNATVFCSMTQEHWDFTFPLQNVRGAKRLIIGTMGHNMDLAQIDHSQVNQTKDANPHRAGFYDAETGEMFRGSGINQMPDGVYIAEEKPIIEAPKMNRK